MGARSPPPCPPHALVVWRLRKNEAKGEGETLDLDVVQSGDGDDEGEEDEIEEGELEEDHMLTAAMIGQSTCRICNHLHGREYFKGRQHG